MSKFLRLNRFVIKIAGTLLIAAMVTLLIPKNQGAIDTAVHDTYYVLNPIVFALGLWMILWCSAMLWSLLTRRNKTE